MGLSEWLGESHNPGNVGKVESGTRQRERRSRAAVLAYFVIAATLIGLWLYILWDMLVLHSTLGLIVGIGLTLIYLVLAYFIHPQPDMSNIGWLRAYKGM